MRTGHRILIVYYSLDGHTQRVAGDLALRLGADLEELHEHTDRHGFFGHVRAAVDSLRERPALLQEIGKRPRDYDLTIVGTPIWAGKITPAVRAYLKSICGEARRIAFFITSGSTPIGKVAPLMEKLAGLNATATTGLSERELRDLAVYDRKLNEFIADLRMEPVPLSGFEPCLPFPAHGTPVRMERRAS